MLKDKRFSIEDIFSTIDFLKNNKVKNYNSKYLNSSRFFYKGNKFGSWKPIDNIKSRETLIIRTGPELKTIRMNLNPSIRSHSPVVLALNTVN